MDFLCSRSAIGLSMRTSGNENTLDRRVGALRPVSSGSGWVRYGYFGALLVAIVLFASVRLRLRNMPLERDEGEFAYVGQLMLEGIPPYKIAGNLKLPGTYAAYAAMMAVFGETAPGTRVGFVREKCAASAPGFLFGEY